MEAWKIMFLSKWVICRFHVNLPRPLQNISGETAFLLGKPFLGRYVCYIPIEHFLRSCDEMFGISRRIMGSQVSVGLEIPEPFYTESDPSMGGSNDS